MTSSTCACRLRAASASLRAGWILAAALLGVFSICLSAAECAAQAAEAPRGPNIVIILADDMGYGDTSMNEESWVETPHLEQLAREGMRLTDFHSNGAVCSPTRAALLTGRYQQRAGIPGVVFADPAKNRHHGLQPREVTFAEVLQEAGYATGIFGKWHLGYEKQYNPTRQGFSQFRGYVSGNVDYFSHVDQTGVFDWWNGLELVDEPGYSTHLITRGAVEFIAAHKSAPFCLYVAHEAPHYPYQGPNDGPERAVGQPRQVLGGRMDRKAAYREMMQELDRGVGEIVAALKKHGLERRTFLFFFSDNGATPVGSNGRLRGQKGTLWEGGHRVPAVAWQPGRIEAGSVSHETAAGMDLFPTVVELTGAKLPPGHRLDGVSLAAMLTEQRPLGERDLFWDYQKKQAVRRGNWKLVIGQEGPSSEPALYNLADDVEEQNNVAEKRPEVVSALSDALRKWQADVAAGATPQPERQK